MSKWLLPERLADILPVQARYIEACRRDLLDLYRSYGYELVQPPLAEYIDSLLSGNGRALNLRTSKLVDQLSGRTMGVRADITPQVARIDAHLLNREGVTRLCYCGPVLHARPAGLLGDRELLQIGAEIFGHSGVQADTEIIELAFESARRAGVSHARLDLNHPGVYKAIIATDAALAPHAELVADLLATKNLPAIDALASQFSEVAAATVQALRELALLYGGAEVLERAKAVLPASPELHAALSELAGLVQALPEVELGIDLADMGTGYGYHSGVVFSVYAEDWHNALIKGGLYDGIGRAFGRDRPATGFSLDLRKLAAVQSRQGLTPAIRAPWQRDRALKARVQELRQAGEVVIQVEEHQPLQVDEFLIDRQLVKENNTWVVKPC